jgi:hypothetical protein
VCTHIDDGGAFTRARAEPMAVHAAAATGAAFAPGTPPPPPTFLHGRGEMGCRAGRASRMRAAPPVRRDRTHRSRCSLERTGGRSRRVTRDAAATIYSSARRVE